MVAWIMPKQGSGVLQGILWDVDAAAVDPKQSGAFIIERVLEHGNERQARWLLRTFPRSAVLRVIKTSRRLSLKSRNFWGVKLGLWSSGRKPSAKRPAGIWKY